MAGQRLKYIGIVVPGSEGRPKGIVIVDEGGKATHYVYVPAVGKKLASNRYYEIAGRRFFMADSWLGVP